MAKEAYIVIAKREIRIKESIWEKTKKKIEKEKGEIRWDGISGRFKKTIHKKGILVRMGFGKSKAIDKVVNKRKGSYLLIIGSKKIYKELPFKSKVRLKKIWYNN